MNWYYKLIDWCVETFFKVENNAGGFGFRQKSLTFWYLFCFILILLGCAANSSSFMAIGFCMAMYSFIATFLY